MKYEFTKQQSSYIMDTPTFKPWMKKKVLEGQGHCNLEYSQVKKFLRVLAKLEDNPIAKGLVSKFKNQKSTCKRRCDYCQAKTPANLMLEIPDKFHSDIGLLVCPSCVEIHQPREVYPDDYSGEEREKIMRVKRNEINRRV